MSNPFDDDDLEGHDMRREIQFVREMNKSSGPGPVGKGFSVQMLKIRALLNHSSQIIKC